MTMTVAEDSQAALLQIVRSLVPTPATISLVAAAEHVLQDLQEHQIELEMQNRELREAQQLLEESRSRYADLFDLAPVGYCAFTLEGELREINLAALEMFGLPRGAIDRQRILASLVPAERAKLEAHLERCFAHATTVHTELTLREDASGPLVVQMLSTPVFDLSGAVVASRTTLTDVSALKRSEATLRFLVDASEALVSSLDYEKTLADVVRLAVPTLADICFVDVLDDDGAVSRLEVAFADPDKRRLAPVLKRAVCDLADESLQSQVLRSGAPLLVADRSSASLSTYYLREAGPANSVMCIPIRMRERTFGVLTLILTRLERRYSCKELTIALEVARRAAAAIENARLYREAQRAVRSRDDLLAVVAHELNSPLTSVALKASMLLDKQLDRAARIPHLQSIGRNAARMQRLIGDLMDVSSLEAGHLAMERREHGVRELLRDACDALQPQAEAGGLTLELLPPERDLIVACDRGRMLQVLINLVGNAIKFTPRGGCVTIGAECCADKIRFEVADTGPGMLPGQVEHAFERFWQANEASHKGAGLGLYIARSLVEAQGGKIWVESEAGAGARFYVTMPRRLQGQQQVTAAAVLTRDVKLARHSPAAQPVILVVDDDPDVRESLTDLLGTKGYCVITARDGRQALEYLSGAHAFPGLIIVDLIMPVMSGTELIEALANDPVLRLIPVIVLSGQHEIRKVASALGVVAHFSKPVQVGPLLDAIGAHHHA